MAKRSRGLWLLASATFLIAGRAQAAGTSLLPQGVHQQADGRYVEELCGTGFKFHCAGVRLLPESYVPPPNPAAQPAASTFCGNGGGGSATVPTTSMAPKDVLAAYKIPSATASGGKIVALVDMPDTKAFSDLTAYRKAFGLPTLPECTGIPNGTPSTPCFAAVDEMGTKLNPTVTDCPLGDGETGLDMDMVSAACPDCSILLVQMTNSDPTNGPDNDDYLNAVATAARLGAVATSISFGDHEATDPLLGDAGAAPDPTGFTKAGTTVFVAAGDFGYDNETINVVESGKGQSPSYPASAPDVIAVGGTNLTSASGTYTETVWNNKKDSQDITTSGCSTEFAALSWQASVLAGTGCTKRATADIAAAATFTSGTSQTAIAAYASGGWEPVQGTSASSPMVAAIFTRLGLAVQMSTDLGFPYAHAAAFNDVTSGSDDIDKETCGKLCTAGAGWDGPTGVGSPNGTLLAVFAGSSDAGAPPVVDAGTGTTADAGSGNADSGAVGSDDAGAPAPGDDDAGTPIAVGGEDSGTSSLDPDAGTSGFDGGVTGSGGSSSGCSCTLTPGRTGANELLSAGLGLGLFAILGARRRRRG